jgi:hypothetical protein
MQNIFVELQIQQSVFTRQKTVLICWKGNEEKLVLGLHIFLRNPQMPCTGGAGFQKLPAQTVTKLSKTGTL